MTQDEMCAWLGFKPGTQLRDDVIAALAPLDFPASGADQIKVFAAFLRAMPKPPEGRRKYVQG